MSKSSHISTVLIVDDDPDELASACRTLGARYPVLEATSGDDALRIVRAARPSAIVMDVMMSGGKDGFTTFHELQLDQTTRDIPVIFLTNVGKASGLPFGSADLDRYLGSKPADFLEKPISTDQLLSAVAKALDERTAEPDGAK